jgi:predicted DNA-binding transcriptional regulator AlpA
MNTTARVAHSRPARSIDSIAMSPDDLAGVAEIAQLLGVHQRTAARYTQRADFPTPAGQLSRGRVWLRADVERWAKRTLPLDTGRPPKRR